MKNQELLDRLLQQVDDKKEQLIDISQYIFDHPEIALEEKISSAYLVDILKKESFEVEYPYCGLETAFKATKKNGEGPRIAYMAEYDALPGAGHACGHNWIAATSLMAGITLAEALETLPGEVTIFGTPAEETGEGKPPMVEQGAFDGYDCALEFHGNYTTCLAPGMIAIGGIDITFTGRASHAGADPSKGVNAMDAVTLFSVAVGLLRQQLRDGTRVHGIVQEAGTAANIIPEVGRLRMEVRAKEMAYFEETLQKVVHCAEGAALATGCQLEWHHFEPTCAGVDSNETLLEMFRENMKKYPEFVEGDDDFAGGASDVGNVSQVIPVLHPMLKIVENGGGCHTKDFYDALMLPYAKERSVEAVKLLVETGLQVLEDPVLAKKL